MIDAESLALIDGPPVRALAADRLSRMTARARFEADDPDGEASFDLTDVYGGVTTGWLAKVFGMDPSDVKKRLTDCPPLHKRKNGYVYSLPQAAQYLVKPKFDVATYMRNMKPSELPAHLQDSYWKSALNRQKFELNAGELWRTVDVIEVLGDVFKTIKFTMQLWAEDLERETTLSEKQKGIVVRMVDGLQQELHEKLLEMKDVKRTPSSGQELLGGDEFDGLI